MLEDDDCNILLCGNIVDEFTTDILLVGRSKKAARVSDSLQVNFKYSTRNLGNLDSISSCGVF